jgi:hypothetical protein
MENSPPSAILGSRIGSRAVLRVVSRYSPGIRIADQSLGRPGFSLRTIFGMPFMPEFRQHPTTASCPVGSPREGQSSRRVMFGFESRNRQTAGDTWIWPWESRTRQEPHQKLTMRRAGRVILRAIPMLLM